mgnify:CR=1 FL=1
MIETVDNKVDKNFNPFPGLRPFGTDESFLYFGREGQSDEVLSILEETLELESSNCMYTDLGERSRLPSIR